jgi:hypothetical protein
MVELGVVVAVGAIVAENGVEWRLKSRLGVTNLKPVREKGIERVEEGMVGGPTSPSGILVRLMSDQ